MIGNRILGYLHNERFSKSNEEKRMAFQNMTWSLIIHKNTIKNCSTVLQAFSLRSLSLCVLYFPFHKDKGISAIIFCMFSPFSSVDPRELSVSL